MVLMREQMKKKGREMEIIFKRTKMLRNNIWNLQIENNWRGLKADWKWKKKVSLNLNTDQYSL